MAVTEAVIAEVCDADRQALILDYKEREGKENVFTSGSVTIGTLVMLDKINEVR